MSEVVIATLRHRIAARTPLIGRLVRSRDDAVAELDRLAAAPSAEVSNDGYCHCCRQQTRFEVTGPWLRDDYLCGRCLCIPRQRHVQAVLDLRFPGWEAKSLHESSPSHDFIERFSRGYSSSQYFEGVPSGDTVDGVLCQDLERLSFEDDTFDIFVTQDVFEHIIDPAAAAREILRVLKPGGVHVFTAPRHEDLPATRPRVRRMVGGIEEILPAEYHGNPVGDGRSIVTWDYGSDFEQLMCEWSSGTMTTFITRDRQLGLDGAYLDVFVNRKPVR